MTLKQTTLENVLMDSQREIIGSCIIFHDSEGPGVPLQDTVLLRDVAGLIHMQGNTRVRTRGENHCLKSSHLTYFKMENSP